MERVGRRRLGVASLVGTLLMASASVRAQQVELLDAKALPYTGDVAQIEGDITADATGAAAVLSRPDGAMLHLEFVRLDRNGAIVLERTLGAAGTSYFQPGICWDSAHYAVAASTLTQSTFLILDAAGDTVLGPIALPGLPPGEGHRTAAFRVRCTPAGYAVFGLLAERSNPTSDLYYGHLHYWLVTFAGAIAANRDLRVIQPLCYPEDDDGECSSTLGFERTYYDAVWTGASFFVAYGSESLSGPPLSVYYETIDLAGNVVRAEAAAFDTTVAIGPVLATNGATVALVALKSVALNGNFVYLRLFDANGTPLAAESLVSPAQGPYNTPPTPFGPTVSWSGREYVVAYADSAFPQLGWQLVFQHFTGNGAVTQAAYPLRNTEGTVVIDQTQAIAIDLQMVGSGARLLGKAQSSNFITNWPVVFALPEPGGGTTAAIAALFALAVRRGRRGLRL